MKTLPFHKLMEDKGKLRIELVDSLAKFGFVKISLPEGTLLNSLRGGIAEGDRMGTFRFPPVGEPAVYTDAHRDCFRALYTLGKVGLEWILSCIKVSNEPAAHLSDLLNRADAQSAELFAPDGLGHAPFADGQAAAFSSSFFNIFDYEHGSLNGHKDRYLTTTIYASVSTDTAHERSALWVRGADDTWRNVDSALAANEVVLMIGEELESLLSESDLGLFAADHCIRVDPNGEFIERAHFRRDPTSLVGGNRVSAAFVLGDESIEALLEERMRA